VKCVATIYLTRGRFAIAIVGNASQIAQSLVDVRFGNVELE